MVYGNMGRPAGPKRHPTSFRLDEETLSLLKAIAEELGADMHDVVRMGARLLAKKHGIELKGGPVKVKR